jgi:hypothetical protein
MSSRWLQTDHYSNLAEIGHPGSQVTDPTTGMAANQLASSWFNPAFPQAFHEDLRSQEQTSGSGVSPLVPLVMLSRAPPRTDQSRLHLYIPKIKDNNQSAIK